MTFYLVEEGSEIADPVQFLYAPESGLLTEQHEFFNLIHYPSDLSSSKPLKISDFTIKGIPKNIFIAESSKKETLGVKDFRNPKEEILAKYFEIGSIPSVDDTIAEVLFLKDSLKGKRVDEMLKRVIEEKASYLLVNFNNAYPNVLEMKYFPVGKREHI